MEYRLPYYMTYPMPLAYDDEKIDRRDFEYMKSMYPDLAKKILPHVEAECDRMEYEGSMIYDEYPDQLQLRMMCSRIYNQVMQTSDRKELWGSKGERTVSAGTGSDPSFSGII